MSGFAFTVKTRGGMERIARALAKTSELAANAYRDSFEVRQNIEKGAQEGQAYSKPEVAAPVKEVAIAA